MKNKALYDRFCAVCNSKLSLVGELRSQMSLLEAQSHKLEALRGEQSQVVKALQALKDVKPLLSVSAIGRAEALANSAISAIFDFPAELRYSEEDQRFVVVTPDGEADLQEGSGGGLQAVVSFVFQVALLMRQNSRLFMAMDEAFTQLDDGSLVRFVDFLNKLCDDLGLDIVLISHDARIDSGSVRRMYRVEGGHAVRLK